jgi:hypothetical protein
MITLLVLLLYFSASSKLIRSELRNVFSRSSEMIRNMSRVFQSNLLVEFQSFCWVSVFWSWELRSFLTRNSENSCNVCLTMIWLDL